jgi:Fe-S oxidoreductase
MTADPILCVDFDKRDEFLELSSLAPAVCFQCGTCTATCPWSELLDKPMTVRKLIHQGLLGLDTDSMLWFCTTCMACETRCPREVDIVKSLLAMRNMAFRKRHVPSEFEKLLWNVLEEGNPTGDPLLARANWAKDLNLKDASQGVDVLLYTGCTSSYDPRIQKVARSLAAILNSTAVDFGILGTKELCCGDPVRSTGESAFLDTLIMKNIETFKSTGANRIVTISPHCYDMFQGLYKEFGLEIEVLHYTELISELLRDGALNLSNGLKGERESERIVTYHDPCYLGRHHSIYDAPRSVLEGIKGIRCVEMEENQEHALCCGGGGGRMWLETEPGMRQSDLRIGQATRTGADLMVTACPYCIQNFEDSTKVLGSNIEVKDIAEIVAEAMGLSPGGDGK